MPPPPSVSRTFHIPITLPTAISSRSTPTNSNPTRSTTSNISNSTSTPTSVTATVSSSFTNPSESPDSFNNLTAIMPSISPVIYPSSTPSSSGSHSLSMSPPIREHPSSIGETYHTYAIGHDGASLVSSSSPPSMNSVSPNSSSSSNLSTFSLELNSSTPPPLDKSNFHRHSIAIGSPLNSSFLTPRLRHKGLTPRVAPITPHSTTAASKQPLLIGPASSPQIGSFGASLQSPSAYIADFFSAPFRGFFRLGLISLLLFVLLGFFAHTSFYSENGSIGWKLAPEPTSVSTPSHPLTDLTSTPPSPPTATQPNTEATITQPMPTPEVPAEVTLPPMVITPEPTDTVPAPVEIVPTPPPTSTEAPPPKPVIETPLSPSTVEPKDVEDTSSPTPSKTSDDSSLTVVPPESLAATIDSMHLSYNSTDVAYFEKEYSCLVQPFTTHMPMLYQLGYDLDIVMSEFHIPYSIEDGTLLGAVRHGGMIPWDDDIDMMVLCQDSSEPCWSLLFDAESPFRAALRRRGLDLYVQYPDDHRFMLKVFSTVNYIADHPSGWYTFPNIDLFLSRKIKCNVSDDIDGTNWYQLVFPGDIEESKREGIIKNLQMYETEIWAYHSLPTPTRFPDGRCSILDNTFNLQMTNEIYPQQRIKFGSIELWGPNKARQVLKRAMGSNWNTHLHRASSGHLFNGMVFAVEQELNKGRPPFKPCMLNLDEVPKKDRAWMTRPGLPMKVDKRPIEERMIKPKRPFLTNDNNNNIFTLPPLQ